MKIVIASGRSSGSLALACGLLGFALLISGGCRPGARSTPAPSARLDRSDEQQTSGSQAASRKPPPAELDEPLDEPPMPPVLVDIPSPSDTPGHLVRTAEANAKADASESGAARPGGTEAGGTEAGGTPVGGEPEDYTRWDPPAVTLVVTGQQNGYLEPCGCTGLDRQKGGVARRFTLLRRLRDRGWDIVPIDTGNQVRRYGRQAEIKYHRTLEALRSMDYQAVGFGPDDIRLSVGDLIQEAAADSPDDALYISANVVLFDPDLMPRFKTVRAGGKTIAITSLLDHGTLRTEPTDEIDIGDPTEAARAVLGEIEATGADFKVLMFYGDEAAAVSLAQAVPGFDLLVVSGGDGEPLYRPRAIPDSSARLIVTGNKAMYAGLVGIDHDGGLKYARVPLTHEFEDAPEMRQLMADYQNQLKEVGLEGLGLRPIGHPSGESFVGSETCGQCHTTAFEIWEATPHALATAHIVEPPRDRGDVARHFDPECLSCHVTGWHPQNYQPYESGYLSLQTGSHLVGNGCENCHGPGGSHVAAEMQELDVTEERRRELRLAMRLPLERAREQCLQCHDLDNSPDFHEAGAFEDVYWPQVEHYGLD